MQRQVRRKIPKTPALFSSKGLYPDFLRASFFTWVKGSPGFIIVSPFLNVTVMGFTMLFAFFLATSVAYSSTIKFGRRTCSIMPEIVFV